MRWRRRQAVGPEADEEVAVDEHASADEARRDGGDGFDTARAAVQEGDPGRALTVLRERVALGAFPAPDVLAGIGALVGGEALTQAAVALQRDPFDHRAMFELGYELYEHGAADVSVPVFRELLRLLPGHPDVLSELVASLDQCGRHNESAWLLREHRSQISGHFTLSYLLAFESVLTGDLETARDAYALLPAADDEGQLEMRHRVHDMLARAEAGAACSELDENDLRGWHFVITGGILTARSPYGAEDGMNGRWAAVYDSYESVHAGLRRVYAVLAAWQRLPPQIMSLPDRASQAVAGAAAAIFGVELADWEGRSDAGLVVAYDLADADAGTLQSLAAHRPGQALYVHAARWTIPPPVAPDLVSTLYQQLIPPWGPRMRVHEVEGKRTVEDVPADESPSGDLARRILDADPTRAPMEMADSSEDVVAFARDVEHLAGAARDSGRREPFWAGSPVESARFP
jgi:hypothetical protein